MATWLQGGFDNDNPTVTMYKTVNGITTGKTSVASMHFYSNNCLSENHGGSDQWIDMWTHTDGSGNNYTQVEDPSLMGTQCLVGYCRSPSIWLMVR